MERMTCQYSLSFSGLNLRQWDSVGAGSIFVHHLCRLPSVLVVCLAQADARTKTGIQSNCAQTSFIQSYELCVNWKAQMWFNEGKYMELSVIDLKPRLQLKRIKIQKKSLENRSLVL
jgi:hypothetical protein